MQSFLINFYELLLFYEVLKGDNREYMPSLYFVFMFNVCLSSYNFLISCPIFVIFSPICLV